ncbi:MAG: 3-dehydroquinate synthase [Planctomycetota bacterium]
MNHSLKYGARELCRVPAAPPIRPAAGNIVHDAVFSCRFTHRLRLTAGAFGANNRTLCDILAGQNEHSASAAVFIDSGVAAKQAKLPDEINAYFEKYLPSLWGGGNRPKIHIVPGGEQIKNGRKNLDLIMDAIEQSHLCRKSFVIAMGGGAVLDAVGFAASIAHRGLRLIRIATTTLSQADSAMAVKNGVNAFGKKNYMGVFAAPWAVINDEATLDTLSERHWLAGFSEAVKVALLKDPLLFEYIYGNCHAIRSRDMDISVPVIRRSARLHFDHITLSGDPFEQGDTRPLDFGHWSAHKLEQMSGFELSHGQAVAIGIAIDATYANLMGWLGNADHRKILDCLSGMGFELYHRVMQNAKTLLGGLDEFQEHLGGRLTIPSINGIGRAFDINSIDTNRMLAAISYLERWVEHD